MQTLIVDTLTCCHGTHLMQTQILCVNKALEFIYAGAKAKIFFDLTVAVV